MLIECNAQVLSVIDLCLRWHPSPPLGGDALTPGLSVPEVLDVWEPGRGDQVAQRIVRSLGSHQDELAALGDWSNNLVGAAVSVGV